MPNEQRTAPTTQILINGTARNPIPAQADTGQTGIKVGLLVYITGSAAANAVSLATAAFGHTVKTESSLYVVLAARNNAAWSKEYDFDTAFPVAATQKLGSSFSIHKLEPGDCFWAKGSSLSTTKESTNLICAASGLVALPAGATTIDVDNVHYFTPLHTVTSASDVMIRYEGRAAFDNS